MVLDYFNPANGRFECCRLENIGEAWCSYASLTQGLLAELFLSVYEDEVDDAVLRACGSLFGFHDIERLLADGAGYKQWRAGLVRAAWTTKVTGDTLQGGGGVCP